MRSFPRPLPQTVWLWAAALAAACVLSAPASRPAWAGCQPVPPADAPPPECHDQQLAGITREREQVAAEDELIRTRLTGLKERIAAEGLTGANRLLLVQHRRNLPDSAAWKDRLAAVQVQLREASFETALEAAPVDPPSGTQPGLSPDVAGSARARALALGQLAAEISGLLARVDHARQFIDGQLLWVANERPLGLADTAAAVAGGRRLLQYQPWAALGEQLVHSALAAPWQPALMAALIAASVWGSRRLRPHQRSETSPASPSGLGTAPGDRTRRD